MGKLLPVTVALTILVVGLTPPSAEARRHPKLLGPARPPCEMVNLIVVRSPKPIVRERTTVNGEVVDRARPGLGLNELFVLFATPATGKRVRIGVEVTLRERGGQTKRISLTTSPRRCRGSDHRLTYRLH